jgi:hypothetical protein
MKLYVRLFGSTDDAPLAGQAPFFHAFITVGGLTCSTQAVSRMPLAFIAILTICCLTAGDCPA